MKTVALLDTIIGRLTGDSLADARPSSINAHSIVASKSQLKSISGDSDAAQKGGSTVLTYLQESHLNYSDS